MVNRRTITARRALHCVFVTAVIAGLLVAVADRPSPAAALTPDPVLTPGALDKTVTQASLNTTVCAQKFLERQTRVASRTANRVFAAYGVSADARDQYTLAPLVPLEVGGAPSSTNLWPRRNGQGLDDTSWLTTVRQHLCRRDVSLATARSLFPDPATWQGKHRRQHPPAIVATVPVTTTTATTAPMTTTTVPGTASTTAVPISATTTAAPTTTTTSPTTTTTAPTTTTTSPTTTTSAPPAAPPPGRPAGSDRFYVVGTNIVAPDGTQFVPVGANVGTTSNFDWRGTGDGHSGDALAWGWNTVRLTIYCTSAADFSIWHQQGYNALLTTVDNFISEYTAKHIVVMVECHDWFANQGDTDRFWTDMAARYRNNPYVWFNAMNEPEWNNNAQWLALQQHYLALVRGQGAENVFVADVMNSGNDAGWDGALPVYDPSMGPALRAKQCNVLFSMHDYGGVDDTIGSSTYWDRVHAANLAMVVGEFGYTIDGTSDAGSYQQNVNGANSVFTAASGKGVGMLWWHATHGDNFSLKISGDAFYADGGDSANLSPAGVRLWAATHPATTPARFSGDLRGSGCPSAL